MMWDSLLPSMSGLTGVLGSALGLAVLVAVGAALAHVLINGLTGRERPDDD